MSCADGCGKDELYVSLELVNQKLKFAVKARTNPELVIDYFPPLGDGEGYTSLELLLSSLGSCISSTLLSLLRVRMQKTITALNVAASGTVRDEHPRAFSHITLELTITSPDVTDSDVQTVLALAEEKLCPVWSMLKGNVEVSVNYRLQQY